MCVTKIKLCNSLLTHLCPHIATIFVLSRLALDFIYGMVLVLFVVVMDSIDSLVSLLEGLMAYGHSSLL